MAIGIMTDSDNTGKTARCHYGDISFLEAERPQRRHLPGGRQPAL